MSPLRSRIYILFKCTRVDHTLGSLNKFKKIEIISSTFSDHNAMKLEINYKNNTDKHTETWKLNNLLLNNEWVNNEIKEEIKRYLEANPNLWDTGKASKDGNS